MYLCHELLSAQPRRGKKQWAKDVNREYKKLNRYFKKKMGFLSVISSCQGGWKSTLSWNKLSHTENSYMIGGEAQTEPAYIKILTMEWKRKSLYWERVWRACIVWKCLRQATERKGLFPFPSFFLPQMSAITHEPFVIIKEVKTGSWKSWEESQKFPQDLTANGNFPYSKWGKLQ